MKKIIKYWNQSFPTLKPKYGNLMETIGPLILGIKFIKSPYGEDYVPFFYGGVLWDHDYFQVIKYQYEVLSSSFFNIGLLNNKDSRYFIDFSDHESNIQYVDKAISLFKNHDIFIPLACNVSLDKILAFFDDYHNYLIKWGEYSSAKLALIYEMKNLILLYYNEKKLSSQLLDEIKKNRHRFYLDNSFERIVGNFDLWINSLENIDIKDLQSNINNNKKTAKSFVDYEILF
ncbi:hypothetical protein ACG2LH_00965 [Zhouia sp. PK063]